MNFEAFKRILDQNRQLFAIPQTQSGGIGTLPKESMNLATLVFSMFDLDENGVIDVEEFITTVGILQGRSRSRTGKLELAFRVMDRDGSGFISRTEFHEIAPILIREGSFSFFNRQKLDELFDMLDLDQNGMISKKEFLTVTSQTVDNPLWSSDHAQFIEKFNHSDASPTAVLQDLNLTPAEVASKLREDMGLNKRRIGECFGKNCDFTAEVLAAFADTFDFEGVHLDIALRIYLGFFVLPGESAQVQRIMEAFARAYVKCQAGRIEGLTEDYAMVACYALIMLSTDHHSTTIASQHARSIGNDDFASMIKGIPGGPVFSESEVDGFYKRILASPFYLNMDSVHTPVTGRTMANAPKPSPLSSSSSSSSSSPNPKDSEVDPKRPKKKQLSPAFQDAAAPETSPLSLFLLNTLKKSDIPDGLGKAASSESPLNHKS